MSTPKNVLFILCDQLRKDWLGCYGHPSVKTPHLDRLAAEGVQCEHNFVAHPICMPNRMSMLTGMHPRNHGQWTNGLLLDPLPPTLPAHLQEQGFLTTSIGKIHLTPCGGDERSYEARKRWREIADAYTETGPYAGFEHVELTLGHGAKPEAHFGTWFYKNGGTDADLDFIRDEGIHDFSCLRKIPVALHPTTFVAERTELFFERAAKDDRPFFAHISFPDPHHPYDPPESTATPPEDEPHPIGGAEDLETRPPHYDARRNGGWSRKGFTEANNPGGTPLDHALVLRARTTAMVNLIDEAVGRILASLEAKGLAEDTLIIFTSDHGDGLGDHGIWGKGPYSFRSVINTPLIVHGPGVTEGVSDKVISDVDLAPSICGALGVEPLPFADGIDLWSHWQDPAQPTREQALIEHRNGFGDKDYASTALAGTDWTYVRYQDGVEELTDLATDPEERRNIATDEPARCAELRCRLLDHLLSTQAKGPEQLSQA